MMIKREYTVEAKADLPVLVLEIDKKIRHRFLLIPFSGCRAGDNSYNVKSVSGGNIHLDSRREFRKIAVGLTDILDLTFNSAFTRSPLVFGGDRSFWFEATRIKDYRRDNENLLLKNWEVKINIGSLCGGVSKRKRFVDESFKMVEAVLAPHYPVQVSIKTAENGITL